MSDVSWPDVSYARWRETCDTLHAHSQLLGKIAVALAPKEPQLQHGALRLTARSAVVDEILTILQLTALFGDVVAPAH